MTLSFLILTKAIRKKNFGIIIAYLWASHRNRENDNMCTAALAPSKELLERTAPPQGHSHQDLLEHVSDCLHCLFAITKQHEPLVVSGCPQFRAMFVEAFPLFDFSESPLGTIHFSEEMIENYHFKRMGPLEKKVFETHAKLCSECATQVHNELLLIYAMKAALSSDPCIDRNRNGATFQAVA